MSFEILRQKNIPVRDVVVEQTQDTQKLVNREALFTKEQWLFMQKTAQEEIQREPNSFSAIKRCEYLPTIRPSWLPEVIIPMTSVFIESSLGRIHEELERKDWRSAATAVETLREIQPSLLPRVSLPDKMRHGLMQIYENA